MNAGLNLVRFLLAANVVAFHLWNAAAPGAGPVAVMGFFFTSGYLITQVVQDVYAGPGRVGAFVLNRSLRIFPQYFAALGFGLFVIHAWPAVAYHIDTYMRWPANTREWIPQLAVFGLIDSNVRVLPAAWTLGTELYFYLLIGLVTGRSRPAALALVLVSLPLGAMCAAGWLPFAFYGSAMGNGFVIALGSLAYFHRDVVRIGWRGFAVAVAAYLVHLYVVPALEQSDLDRLNITLCVLPFAVILLFLVQHPLPRHGRAAALFDLLGKLAYPLFLLHWSVSVVLSAWLFDGQASFEAPDLRRGGEYFGTMFAGALVCSLVFYLLIDRPVELLRRRVRRREHPPTPHA